MKRTPSHPTNRFWKRLLPLVGLLGSPLLSFGQALTPISPPDGSTQHPWSETLEASVQGTSGDVSFYGRNALPPGPDFTVVMLPDTQLYTIGENATSVSFFTEQVDWIVSNRTALNIAAVTHIGDVVQNYDTDNTNEWEHAAAAMYQLHDPVLTGLTDGIPYGILPGNHDVSGTVSTMFNQWFGTANFSGRSWYGGNQGTNNDNFYIRFEASGVKFVLINIEWKADLALVGTWARAVLQAHPDHFGIVSSHYVLRSGNPGLFVGEGPGIYDALKTEPNFILMLGGHTSVEGQRTDTFNGNVAHSVLANYQSMPNGGNGWLRLWRFSPADNKIYATTYSPVLDASMSGQSSEFDLPLDFNRLKPWNLIGTDPAVAAGTTATVPWNNLAPGNLHEWYAVIGSSTSSVSTFTTEPNVPPDVAAIPTQMIDEGDTFSYTASATDTNQTAQALSFFLNQAPAGTSINVNSGEITWPTDELTGPSTQTVQLVARDDASPPLEGTQTFSIVVNEINLPPVVSIVGLPGNPGFLTAETGSNLILQISTTDPDIPANNIALSLVNPPAGVTLIGNQLHWSPSTNQAGSLLRLEVQASDDGGPPKSATDAGDVLVTQNGQLILEPLITRGLGTATLTWPAFPGKTYRLETSPDLVTPTWTHLSDVTASSNLATHNLATVVPDQRIFVRISLLP